MRVTPCPASFECAPAPGADEALAWVVDLTRPPVPFDALFERLIPPERTRADRYRPARNRDQFVIGRGLLRGLLGAYLGTEPCAVPLTYLSSGKPTLELPDPPLHFNVTHTDGVLVIAAARRRVGVDVERVRALPDADGLVDRFFSSAEAQTYRTLPEHRRPVAFFRGWTCKEAVIKAAGATTAYLADFDVELHPDRPPRVNAVRAPQLAGAGWALTEWHTGADIAVALAVEGARDLIVERQD